MTAAIKLLLLLLMTACAVASDRVTTGGQEVAPPVVVTAVARSLPNFATATPVDDALRAQYERCDREDRFDDLAFPIKNPNGSTRWFGCRSDPSRLERFVMLPAKDGARQSVVWTSKLALDLDGSWIACNRAGITDQCGTTLMLPATATKPCVIPNEPTSRCVPVDADRVPYVVMPRSGPPGSRSSVFQDRTGIGVGDFGVVIVDGRPPVPVIVADTGPFYKVGEGSLALHRALGHDVCTAHNSTGECSATSQSGIGRGVTTIIFPGTRRQGLTPDNIGDIVATTGAALHAALLKAYPN